MELFINNQSCIIARRKGENIERPIIVQKIYYATCALSRLSARQRRRDSISYASCPLTFTPPNIILTFSVFPPTLCPPLPSSLSPRSTVYFGIGARINDIEWSVIGRRPISDATRVAVHRSIAQLNETLALSRCPGGRTRMAYESARTRLRGIRGANGTCPTWEARPAILDSRFSKGHTHARLRSPSCR